MDCIFGADNRESDDPDRKLRVIVQVQSGSKMEWTQHSSSKTEGTYSAAAALRRRVALLRAVAVAAIVTVAEAAILTVTAAESPCPSLVAVRTANGHCNGAYSVVGPSESKYPIPGQRRCSRSTSWTLPCCARSTPSDSLTASPAETSWNR